jgi:hypothetical protein
MARSIHNGMDIINSRDVIARIAKLESDLQSEHDSAVEEGAQTEEDVTDEDKPVVTLDFEEWLKEQADADNADAQELVALRTLAEQAEGYASDWRHGAALIRDDYFERYAQELAEDIGAIQSDAAWPACHIDWEAAADALKQDYTEVDYDGVSYWVRS